MKNGTLELILALEFCPSWFCDAANGGNEDSRFFNVSSLCLLIEKTHLPLGFRLIPAGTFTGGVEDHMGSQMKLVHCRFHICVLNVNISETLRSVRVSNTQEFPRGHKAPWTTTGLG